MRSAVLQLPASRNVSEQRQVLRAAIRQLDRAEIYFDAIAAMDLDDRVAKRALNQLKADLDGLRRYLSERRSAVRG
jgi:hypothetical protein